MKRLREAVYRLYSQHFCRATLVEGTPAHGGPAMRCLFVGSTEFNHFFEDRIYASPPAVLRSSRLWIPRVPSLLATSPPAFDLGVADLPLRHARRFEGRADYRTEPMVFQQIDLSSDWARQRSYPGRAPQLIRKNGFSCSVSREHDDFLWFYERMYRPYALAKFGELAALSSFDDLERRMAQGFLLFVSDASQRIAGSLCFVTGDTFTYYKVGVLDGSRSHVSRGAVSALYHYQIEHARRLGCRHVELLSSRPLLDDPVYTYKRKWGADRSRGRAPRVARPPLLPQPFRRVRLHLPGEEPLDRPLAGGAQVPRRRPRRPRARRRPRGGVADPVLQPGSRWADPREGEPRPAEADQFLAKSRRGPGSATPASGQRRAGTRSASRVYTR